MLLIFITILGLSVGYSALNTDLSISGDANIIVNADIAQNKILNDNGGAEYIESKGVPDFSQVATTDEGMYATLDNDGTSYYFRGAVDNNWLYFAGYYWRIIRINGDGSIRIIYNGTSSDQTGSDTQIGVSAFNEFNNDNAYVGYMYGSPDSDTYEETHANINDSTIKTMLDDWYKNNLIDYSDSISLEAGFCNDRQAVSGVYTSSNYGTLAYGKHPTTYAPFGRLYANNVWKNSQTPSLKCNQTNDLFTIKESSKGNHSLVYSIGLITSDEIVFAGGMGGNANVDFYLYTGQNYWTMSPANLYSYVLSSVFAMNSVGYLGFWGNRIDGVRPVINLKSSIMLSGDGTKNNPYRIVN